MIKQPSDVILRNLVPSLRHQPIPEQRRPLIPLLPRPLRLPPDFMIPIAPLRNTLVKAHRNGTRVTAYYSTRRRRGGALGELGEVEVGLELVGRTTVVGADRMLEVGGGGGKVPKSCESVSVNG